MKRILLINFGRMGDILQTSPLIAYLKEQHPGSKIGCLIASGFEQVMRGIPGIDFHHPLELGEYMLPLKKGNLMNNLSLFKGLIDELKSREYDTIYNLTHNRLGAVLSWLLPGETIGLTLDSQRIAAVENLWMRQFYNTNINRGLNQFNLVDLYRLAAGFESSHTTDNNSRLHFNISPEAREWARNSLLAKGWEQGRKTIGFQVGASAESKAWNPEYFNSTAKSLAEDYNIIFFGGEKEKPLVGAASQGLPGAINFAGETGIAQLATVLEKCDVLLSNDTGTQHLAAAVGTPVASLTMGPALASETGPFGEGHIVIEPDIECGPCSYHHKCLDYKCHSHIRPELVERVLKDMTETGKVEKLPSDLTVGIKISRTTFDENGLWELQPLEPGALTLRDRVNIAYRKAWFDLLNSDNINDIDYNRESGKDIALDIIEIVREVDSLVELVSQGVKVASELCRLAAAEPIDINRIREAGARLTDIDLKISALGDLQPELRPLTLDFNLGKEALPEANLKRLTELTEQLYRRLKAGALLFKKYLTEPDRRQKRLEIPLATTAGRKVERVLAIDTPYFATGEVIRALERRGVDLKVVSLNPEVKYKQGGPEEFIGSLLHEAESFKPDFLFTVNHLGFDSEGYLQRELEKIGVPSAVYYVDSPLLIMEDPEKMSSELSQIFCWDEYYVGRLRDLGFHSVEYLPLATDINFFHPREPGEIPQEYRTRLAFVGDSLNKAIQDHISVLEPSMISAQVEREIESLQSKNGKVLPEILEAAADKMKFTGSEQRRRFIAAWLMKIHQRERLKTIENISDLGLTIFGDDYWEGMFSGRKPALRGLVRYFDQLPFIYAGAEIGFNATSFQMPRGLNQRAFDIPAAGGFLLTDYRPALEEIFDLKKDIAVYKDSAEARELVDYYLKHPQQREKMSASAREKIITAHTYDHRIETIINKMSLFAHISAASIGVAPEQPPAVEISTVPHMPTGMEALKRDLTDRIDVPQEISTHRFGEKSLIITPERAAWIVTDEIGAEITKSLSAGMTMGEAAATAASRFDLSTETALRKLREVIELMNIASFRKNFDTEMVDIDENPRNLQLFLTRSCNLKCRHCYFSAGKPMSEELSTDEWKEIIRKFALLGQGSTVTFSGGEPLVRPDFFDIAQEAVDQGLKVILLSNGILINNPAIARRIAEIVESVQISLDGVSAEINDAIRGAGSFQGGVEAVKLLLTEKVEVEITSVVLPENVDDFEKNLMEFVKSFGSNRLRYAFSVANPKGRMKGRGQDETESLVGRVVSACGDAPWLRTGRFQSACLYFGCNLARSIVVNPEGKIGNCPYMNYSGPRNVRSGDFSKLVSEDREWHRQAIQKSTKCKTCDLRNFQCGGCKIFGECTDQMKLRSYYRMLEGK